MSDSRYRFHGSNQPARRSVLNTVEPAEVDAAGVVTFQLYDPIDSWGGEWGVSAKEFTAALSLLDADAVNKIQVHINSPGGEVFEAITIINALRRFDARVVAVVDGLAASAASVLAAAADELVMAPNSTLMIHDAWGVCVGPATDMRSMADLLDKLSDNIADVYAAKAGGSAADWRERMRAETWYTADEAVEAGLANSVEARGSVEPAASFDLSIYQPSPVTGQVAAFWDGASALAATRHRLNGEKVS